MRRLVLVSVSNEIICSFAWKDFGDPNIFVVSRIGGDVDTNHRLKLHVA